MSDKHNHGYCDKCGCIANTHRSDCVTQQPEIERLRAFVAAFDEWQAAPQSENRDVLEQALWLYEKMLAAREAVGPRS